MRAWQTLLDTLCIIFIEMLTLLYYYSYHSIYGWLVCCVVTIGNLQIKRIALARRSWFWVIARQKRFVILYCTVQNICTVQKWKSHGNDVVLFKNWKTWVRNISRIIVHLLSQKKIKKNPNWIKLREWKLIYSLFVYLLNLIFISF